MAGRGHQRPQGGPGEFVNQSDLLYFENYFEITTLFTHKYNTGIHKTQKYIYTHICIMCFIHKHIRTEVSNLTVVLLCHGIEELMFSRNLTANVDF